METKRLFTIIFILLVFAYHICAQVPVQDSLALVALYDSTDGDNWIDKTNWLSEVQVGDWYGITVNDGHVTVINLQKNNLNGPIPVEISNLSNLIEIRLNNNLLTGSIPSELGNLSNLTDLWLYSNQLTDSIPSELGNLDSLKYLIISNNQFEGSIPATLGNLTKLESINLSNNRLSGSVPDELMHCTNLRIFTLAGNQLSGEIPENLGNLTGLVNLYWDRNQLTGSLPESMGNLTNLEYITLYRNKLSGEIPDTLGNLSRLQQLLLSGNQFSGTIPEALGKLDKLKNLYLNENQLTGTIPDSLGKLTNLTWLQLQSNQLTGSIPDALGNLSSLTHMNLYDNQLVGAVPVSIVNISGLIELSIQNNTLEELPDLNALSSLTNLRINDNQFTFEDIEPNIDVANNTFIYSPQDSIGMKIDTSISEGESLEMSVTVDGTANQYQWFKNGVEIDGATQNTLTLSDLKTADSGIYTCNISNTIATELILSSRPVTVTVEGTSALSNQDIGIPKEFSLHQNYPNPFNPETIINYELPVTSYVNLHIYNLLGQKVESLVQEEQNAGFYQITWDASRVAGGIYFYKIQTDQFSMVRKMVLVR